MFDKYGETQTDEIKQEILNSIKEYEYFDIPLKDRTDLQVLKSLDCFLYQCSEGEIDKNPLYIAMDKIRNALKSEIINELEGYKLAVWN